jgi:hypothetical protein
VKKFLQKLPSILGQIGIGVAAAVIGAGVLAAIALVKQSWARATWYAVRRSWHWLGRDIALPHWLFLVLIGLVLAAAVRLIRAVPRKRSSNAPVVDAQLVANAKAWREAFVALVDTFLARRAQMLAGRAFDEQEWDEQEWLREYRELRKTTMETYRPIMSAFRPWIRDVAPEYLNEYRDEPHWPDFETGMPDDSADGLVDKLWMPVTFTAAIGFWKNFDQRMLQGLAAERIDLVDAFIRQIEHPIQIEQYRVHWRIRLRRWRRRQWKRLRGESVKNGVGGRA